MSVEKGLTRINFNRIQPPSDIFRKVPLDRKMLKLTAVISTMTVNHNNALMITMMIMLIMAIAITVLALAYYNEFC